MIDFKDDILLGSTLKSWKKFEKDAQAAFKRGKLDSIRNSPTQKMKWDGND